MKITRLYADCTEDVMRIDGTPVGPWVRALRRTVIYADKYFDVHRHLFSFMNDEDEVVGTPSKITGVTLKTGKSSVRVIAGDPWGGDVITAEDTRRHIERSYEVLSAYGHSWSPTAASVAINMFSKHAVFDLIQNRLNKRWHGLANWSIHAGPIIHVKKWSANCAHIDRRSAYLAAMYGPMPFGRMVQCNVKTALSQPSIIDAVVNVPWHNTPPLPLKTQRNRVIYRYGKIRGCWPSNLLRAAIKHYGVTIEKFYGAATWESQTESFARTMVDISMMPKDIAKPIYTRLWGKLARDGGWTGSKRDLFGITRGNGFSWRYDSNLDNEKPSGPFYRPDLAAWIVGDNHASMVAALSDIPGVVAAHIDAIWADDSTAIRAKLSEDIGGFKLEEVGRTQFFGVGQYATLYDGDKVKIGAQGWQGGAPPDYQQMLEWVSRPAKQIFNDETPPREWRNNTGPLEKTAYSVPIESDPGMVHYRPCGGPNPWSSGWTDNETYKDPSSETALDV